MNGWAPPVAGPWRPRLGSGDVEQQEHEDDGGAVSTEPPKSLQPDQADRRFAPPKTPAFGAPAHSPAAPEEPETGQIDVGEAELVDELEGETEGEREFGREQSVLSELGAEIPQDADEACADADGDDDQEGDAEDHEDDLDYEPGDQDWRAQRDSGSLGSRRSSAAGQSRPGFAPPPPRRPPQAHGHTGELVDGDDAEYRDAQGQDDVLAVSVRGTRRVSQGRPYGCAFEGCSKAFSRRSDLVRHQRIHDNARPYECPVCKKTFIQRSALTVHERTHTGERPHLCETCNRPFADSSSLARHRRVHSGEKPYRCGLCSKEFCRKITLDKHYDKHHGPNRDQRLADEAERRRLAAAERERQKLIKLERLHEERRKRQKNFGEELAREYRLPPPNIEASTSKPGPSRYGPYAAGRSSRRWKSSTSFSSQSEPAAAQAGPLFDTSSSFPRYRSHSSRLDVEEFVPAPPAGTFFAPASSHTGRPLLKDFHHLGAPSGLESSSSSQSPLSRFLTDEYGRHYEVDEYGNAISDETMQWDVPAHDGESAGYGQSYEQTAPPRFAYTDTSRSAGAQSWDTQHDDNADQAHFFASFDGESRDQSNVLSQRAPSRSFFEPHLGAPDTWIAPIRVPLPPDAASTHPVLPSIDPSLTEADQSLAHDTRLGSALQTPSLAPVASPDHGERRQPTLTREQLPDWLRSPRRPASRSPVAGTTYLPVLSAQTTNGESPRPRNRHYGFSSPLSSLAHNPASRYSPAENGSSRSWYDVAPLHASPPTSHLAAAGARYGHLAASPSALRLSRYSPLEGDSNGAVGS